jgi:hypothetical protein
MPKSFKFNNTKSLKMTKKIPKKDLCIQLSKFCQKKFDVTVSKKQMEDCKEPCDAGGQVNLQRNK